MKLSVQMSLMDKYMLLGNNLMPEELNVPIVCGIKGFTCMHTCVHIQWYITDCPLKMIIRLLASISFEIITNYLHLTENPIRFCSEVIIRIFVRHVISPFHPNFDRKETRTTQWTLNSTLLLNGLCRGIYKTGIEGTYDIPNKNLNFFVTAKRNRMGFSPKCR